MIVEYPQLQTPATLSATATYTSLPIPCRGARAVAFLLTSGDIDTPGSYTIQVRKGKVGSSPAGLWQAVAAGIGGVVATTPAPTALNVGGQVCTLTGVASATSNPGVIMGWDEARILVVGHATLDITAFAVKAQVIADSPGERWIDESLTATVI